VGASRQRCDDGARPLAWHRDSPSSSHGLGKPFPAFLLLFGGLWREWGEEEAGAPDWAVQAHWKGKMV